MTWNTINEPILYAEGGPIFGMIASGAIYKGQALSVAGDMEVHQASSVDDAFIGVAQYDATDNKYVTILGPGNVVRMLGMPGASGAVGDDVMCSGSEGKFSNLGLGVGAKIGVLLQPQSSNRASFSSNVAYKASNLLDVALVKLA